MEANPSLEYAQIPYLPYANNYKISKILSVQLKVFAEDANGSPFVPEDTACSFILKE